MRQKKNTHPLSLGMTGLLNRRGWAKPAHQSNADHLPNAKADFNNVFIWQIQLPAISLTITEK